MFCTLSLAHSFALIFLFFLQADDQGYNPNCITLPPGVMETWNTTIWSSALSDVPGIGRETIEILKGSDVKIHNTFQLFASYLKLKGPEDEDENTEVTVGVLNQKFWYYLTAIGITEHRSAIVWAMAEKAQSLFPGFYDANEEAQLDGSDDE